MNKVICLCGSTKFKTDFLNWNRYFTLKNYIVLMPGVFGHSGDKITDEQKIKLDQLHKIKIAFADEVFIVDKDGYIGQSTKSEIDYATKLNKPIIYMSEMEEKDS